jgi:hypothetical protein
MNAERIEQARRFGGELCDIDGCPELGTLEHVTAHLTAPADMARRLGLHPIDARCNRCGHRTLVIHGHEVCQECIR